MSYCSTTSAIAASVSWTDQSVENCTRMKNVPLCGESNCLDSTILALTLSNAPVMACTIPGWLGPDRVTIRLLESEVMSIGSFEGYTSTWCASSRFRQAAACGGEKDLVMTMLLVKQSFLAALWFLR